MQFEKTTYKVYKSGVPFYDAARLIGVAHLFFGTASAEVTDREACWEVTGVNVERDEDQINWIIDRIRSTNKERELFRCKNGKFAWKELHEYFAEIDKKGRKTELKKEHDAALEIGTRGPDPLSKYEILATRSTGERKKKFFSPFQEVAAATLGIRYAAIAVSGSREQRETTYILPVFSDHFVLSGFLEFKRYYRHPAGRNVAAVLAALSILLDLTSKKILVLDFTYNRIVKSRQALIFSESGYLGFEKLCGLWVNAFKDGDESKVRVFRQVRTFLGSTSSQHVDNQTLDLARHLAHFAVTLDVDSLVIVERLKARILASAQNAFPVSNLFRSYTDIIEVGKMMETRIEIPKGLVDSVANILSHEGKGWMNKLTKLENAPTIGQFLTETERLISRGVYAAQAQKRDLQEIHKMEEDDLVGLQKLHDSRSFRAFKALFLLAVLGRMRIVPKGGE
jgi:hypothetical protein